MTIVEHSMRGALRHYVPVLIDEDSHRAASVAMILKKTNDELQMFFIERAKHENDPWSGQIAFPGGGKEPHDEKVYDTACRETFEEVALRLDESMLVGRLDDQQGRNRRQNVSLVISCFVFLLTEDQPVVHNNEVGDSLWVPVSQLIDDARAFEYQTNYSPTPFPARRFDSGHILWGLTYRFVERFCEITNNG